MTSLSSADKHLYFLIISLSFCVIIIPSNNIYANTCSYFYYMKERVLFQGQGKKYVRLCFHIEILFKFSFKKLYSVRIAKHINSRIIF